MSSLYLLLDIAVISIPLAFSFNSIGHFYKRLKPALIAIFLVGAGFILWDVWFTNIGIWGFNEDYLIGISIINLPLEEWLFFLCIPYACLFSYDQLTVFGVKDKMRVVNFGDFLFLAVAMSYLFIGFDGLYTSIVSILTIALFILFRIFNPENRTVFYLTYGLILIPFIVTNGILTGYATPEPVVWYNDSENLGLRFGTIPIEDFLYYYTMFGYVYLIYAKLKKAT